MSFDLVVNEHASPAETYRMPLYLTTSNSPVLESALAGKASLIKLSSKSGESHLRHYLSEKSRNPASTCATFLIARTGRTNKLAGLMASMHKGEAIPPGAQILVDENGRSIPTNFHIDVYIDRPGKYGASLSKINSMLTFKYMGLFNDMPARVLIDSGATQCFVSQEAASKAGVRVDNSRGSIEVEVANGEVIRSAGMAKARLCLQGYCGTISAEVLPNFIPGIDVILGDSWLREQKANLCYDTTTCTVRKGHRRVPLSSSCDKPLMRISPKAVNYAATAIGKGAKPLEIKARKAAKELRKGAHGL